MFAFIGDQSRITIQTIVQVFAILDRPTKRKLILVGILQIVLSILDLVSVALVGVIASLAIRGVQSQTPGVRTEKVLEFLHLGATTFQTQVMLLSGISVALLIGKTFCSIFVTKRALKFLSLRSAAIGRGLIQNVLKLPLDKLQQIGLQKFQYNFGPGITSITLGIVGVSTTILADLSLLLVLGIGLLYLSPSVAFISLLFFGSVTVALHYSLRNRAKKIGTEIRNSEIQTNKKISESFLLYRELFVRSSRSQYVDEIGKLRGDTAQSQADQTLLPNLSKYIVEVAIVLGATLIAGFQFLTQTATVAMASLGLFLMAGSRIAPALLRLQQSFMQIESNVDSAISTLMFINEYSHAGSEEIKSSYFDSSHESFEPQIQLENVHFQFEDSKPLLRFVNLQILSGEFIAIVGPSGSGKTTLINLILGLINPTSGVISISGCRPIDAINKWPGAISYVPQEVHLITGTLKENIELGMQPDNFASDALDKVLSMSQLIEFTSSLESGVHSQIGEAGRALSGGQKQRLGLARALFTNPKILVLDEATSALDGGTERAISDLLFKLRGSVTVVIIAHRLSTVQKADRVIYIDRGSILADGTFDSVRNKVPDFDMQARLMGL